MILLLEMLLELSEYQRVSGWMHFSLGEIKLQFNIRGIWDCKIWSNPDWQQKQSYRILSHIPNSFLGPLKAQPAKKLNLSNSQLSFSILDVLQMNPTSGIPKSWVGKQQEPWLVSSEVSPKSKYPPWSIFI